MSRTAAFSRIAHWTSGSLMMDVAMAVMTNATKTFSLIDPFRPSRIRIDHNLTIRSTIMASSWPAKKRGQEKILLQSAINCS